MPRLPKKAQRMRQLLEALTDASTRPRYRHDVGDAAVEESVRRLAVGRAIIEPIERGRGIDAGEQPALGIEVEVGRGIAGRVPHRVDRVVEKLEAEPDILRQC